jgi:pimeloyl-ACP methyl ester carboxylesterase
VIIDDAGHWVQQEKPAETNAALLEFLRGIGWGK